MSVAKVQPVVAQIVAEKAASPARVEALWSAVGEFQDHDELKLVDAVWTMVDSHAIESSPEARNRLAQLRQRGDEVQLFLEGGQVALPLAIAGLGALLSALAAVIEVPPAVSATIFTVFLGSGAAVAIKTGRDVKSLPD